MIELYHWEPSGDSAKLLIALKEKNLAYTGHYVDMLKLEQFAPDYLKLAPQGQVPVLIDDGRVLADATFALEYLAEKYEPRLAPADASSWYDLQALFNIVNMPLTGSIRLLGWYQAMRPAMSAADREALTKRMNALPSRAQASGWAQVTSDAEASEDQLEVARERIRGALSRIEHTLSGQAWLAGDAYSIADINVYAMIRTLPRLLPAEVNEQKTPKILKWLSVVEKRPAVAAVLAMRKDGKDAYAIPNT